MPGIQCSFWITQKGLDYVRLNLSTRPMMNVRFCGICLDEFTLGTSFDRRILGSEIRRWRRDDVWAGFTPDEILDSTPVRRIVTPRRCRVLDSRPADRRSEACALIPVRSRPHCHFAIGKLSSDLHMFRMFSQPLIKSSRAINFLVYSKLRNDLKEDE